MECSVPGLGAPGLALRAEVVQVHGGAVVAVPRGAARLRSGLALHQNQDDCQPQRIKNIENTIENQLRKKKIKNEEYQGLRVTTKQILSVVKTVLANDLNKLISNEITKYGGKPKRFDGIRQKIINSKIAMNGNIGFVGEPKKINKSLIQAALGKNQIPVIAPLGYDSNKNTLNINADTAAAFIAETVKAERLLLLTDVEGVMDNNKKLITELDRKKAFQYIKKGTIKSGMIPKIKACFNTLKNGAKGVALIDGRKQNAVVMELLTTKGAGTLIKK